MSKLVVTKWHLPKQEKHTFYLFSPLTLAMSLMQIIFRKGSLILDISAKSNILAQHFKQIKLVNYS
jgi:hypothetical protein